MRRFNIILWMLSLLILAGCVYAEPSDREEYRKYNEFIEKFEAATVQVLEKEINDGKSFFLYTGRQTCPWCRELVPLLGDLIEDSEINYLLENKNIMFYNLDSELTESDTLLKNFRERYEIESVPSILFFSDQKTKTIPITIINENIESDILKENIIKYIK